VSHTSLFVAAEIAETAFSYKRFCIVKKSVEAVGTKTITDELAEFGPPFAIGYGIGLPTAKLNGIHSL